MCSTTCNTANVWAGNLPFRGHRLDRTPQHLQHYRLGLRPRPCSGPVQPRCCAGPSSGFVRPVGAVLGARCGMGSDYSTPTGRMLAGILATLAAYERELMHGRAAADQDQFGPFWAGRRVTPGSCYLTRYKSSYDTDTGDAYRPFLTRGPVGTLL